MLTILTYFPPITYECYGSSSFHLVAIFQYTIYHQEYAFIHGGLANKVYLHQSSLIYGNLAKKVYPHQSPRVFAQRERGFAYKLKRSLNELKQTPK